MTAQAERASARPWRATAPASRPHLTALAKPAWRGRPKLVHALVALGGLAAIVVAQLSVSVAIGQGAFELRDIQRSSAELARHEQTLAENAAVLASPQNIAVSADELGMQQGQPSSFLSLTSGGSAGGPDATHLQAPSAGRDGMAVPNALLGGEAAEAVADTVQRETEQQTPGSLQPAAASDTAGSGDSSPGSLKPEAGSD